MTQRHIASRIDGPTVALLIGPPMLAGVMLGANQTRAGAFMPWLGSIGYWIAISLATWWLIAIATRLVDMVLRPWHPPAWLVWVAGAVAGSFVARPAIYAITDVFRPLMRAPVLRGMRPWAFDLDFLGYYIANWSLIIALWVAACAVAAYWRQRQPVATPEVASDDAAIAQAHGILLRLPPAIGRDVIALQAEDHYVRAHTMLGNALVLGSLSDAIADLERSGLIGQRTHRSWWVASNAVAARVTRGRHIVLVLANGIEVPVSVTYRQTATTGGLLPT
jgi:LytTr DNA-binding domain